MIIVHPDNRLREISKPIPPEWSTTGGYQAAFQEALEAMNKAKGAGISGVQIGMPYRFFWMKDEQGLLELVVNPVGFESLPSYRPMSEGCLSFPGVFEKVIRYDKIFATYERALFPSTNSIHVEKELTGLKAQVFQHEFEHLDGVLLIDHLDPIIQKRVTNRLKKWKMKGYL
jgi:peptide deformylase